MKCRQAATKGKKYFQVLILFMKKMAFLLKLFFYHQLTLHNPRPWKWTMARDWESIDKINIVVVTGNLVVSSQSRSVASSVISGIIYDIIAVNASFLASGLESQRLTWRIHPPCLCFCSVSVCQLISCLLSPPPKKNSFQEVASVVSPENWLDKRFFKCVAFKQVLPGENDTKTYETGSRW